MKVTKLAQRRLAKKKFFYPAHEPVFSAAAKPVQADTSVADIQEANPSVSTRCSTLQRSQDRDHLFSIETDLSQDTRDELNVKIATSLPPPVSRSTHRQRTGRHGYRNLYHHRWTQKLYNFTSPYYTMLLAFWSTNPLILKVLSDPTVKTIEATHGSATQRLITELGKKKGLTLNSSNWFLPRIDYSFTSSPGWCFFPWPYLATLVNGQNPLRW